MRHIQTDVLVIGGGATGTGIFRDLCMRGFKTVLVERRDLAYGTTGRYHGLLHSGARYVVRDPAAAKECIVENQILHKIMPQCIEDTGGYFVLTQHDDPAYLPLFIEGCQKAGIPCEDIPIRQMLQQEPALDPKIMQCFQVPDASADSFLASDLNVAAGKQYGGMSFTYHEVIRLEPLLAPMKRPTKITGAVCHDLIKDEEVRISAEIVVNAAGAWAGKIAQMAGISLHMVPGKGTMLALNHRIVNRVINRCRIPSDGDILVPTHTVAVMGTTDIRVLDPDHYAIEPWEIRLMLEEGEKFIPRFKEYRILRTWAGVRPLINETVEYSNREISRTITLLDHTVRDGIDGIVTIAGGKWTTYRKMAEVSVDKVCEKLKTLRECRTHQEILPSLKGGMPSKYHLGAHLKEIEQEEKYGELICECELVTTDEIHNAIIDHDAKTIDDIRRDVRLGMGPCQATFCAIRAAGLLQEIRHQDISETNFSLRNFLQERWKGNLSVLTGQQLRQMRLNELVYINNFNVAALPGQTESNISPVNYEKPAGKSTQHPRPQPITTTAKTTTFSYTSDIIIIGSGLSGLVAAWKASKAGKKVRVVAQGCGSQYWGNGSIDLFGYQPPNYNYLINFPTDFLEAFVKSTQKHPYSILGLDSLNEAFTSFVGLCNEYNYPFYGSIGHNILLPTAIGTIRPTCLAPFTMIAGDIKHNTPMLIVGIDKYYDFFPSLIADNLNKQGIFARSITLALKSIQKIRFVSSISLAKLFENIDFRLEVIDELKPKLGSAGRVGFPAVLGIDHCQEVVNHLESGLGVPVFEIPSLPPSIPGIRLNNLLVSAIENYGGTIDHGIRVCAVNSNQHTISSIVSEASARKQAHSAKKFVLATGGILGGGIQINNGYAQEAVFNLPISIPEYEQWFQENYISQGSHPIFSSGIDVDMSFQPINKNGHVLFDNLYAIGSGLCHCDPVREHSIEGIAITTGYKVGDILSRP